MYETSSQGSGCLGCSSAGALGDVASIMPTLGKRLRLARDTAISQSSPPPPPPDAWYPVEDAEPGQQEGASGTTIALFGVGALALVGGGVAVYWKFFRK